MSAYRIYTVRRELVQGLEVGRRIEATIAASYRRTGQPPADAAAAGLSETDLRPRSPFVVSIQVVDGRIDLRFGHEANQVLADRRLSLTPYETADMTVVWVCGNAIPGPGLQPLGFAGGTRQAAQVPTAIEGRYLPRKCR